MEMHPDSMIFEENNLMTTVKKSFFQSMKNFFIDNPHPWREERFELTLETLKNALEKHNRTEASLLEQVKKGTTPLHYELSHVIKKFYCAETFGYSKRYYNFLKSLRKALLTEQYTNAFLKGYWQPGEARLFEIIHLICRTLFTEVHIETFCQEVVNTVEQAGISSEDAQSPLVMPPTLNEYIDSLQQTYNRIVKAPSHFKIAFVHEFLQMMRGHFNFRYDSHLQENLPYHLFSTTLPNEGESQKTLKSLRIGTPTQEKFFGFLFPTARINPEFIGFLNDLRFHKKRHVYFNLQLRKHTFLWQNESYRCNALEKIQDDYPDTLLVITLAKNSLFYYQKGHFEAVENASIFKELFLKELCEGHHFYFPKRFLEDPKHNFSHEMYKLLDLVHHQYFDNSDSLTLDERKDFIEIFYTHLQQYCLAYFNADSYNITCRDGIDRAGAANTLFYLKLLLERKSKPSDEEIAKIKDLLFAPALFVKKRAIRYSRLKRFLSAAHRLL